MVEAAKSLRFMPSRSEGLPDVREVAVYPDRLEVNMEGRWASYPFAAIARPQEPPVCSFLKRIIGKRPWPRMVADRDWFHPPKDRFFVWYSDPPLETYLPNDEAEDYGASCFLRIKQVVQSGGFSTFDLGWKLVTWSRSQCVLDLAAVTKAVQCLSF